MDTVAEVAAVTEWWAALMVLIAAFVGSWGALLFKQGADKLEFNLRALVGNVELMKGLAVYAAGTIFYIIGIKGGELSVLFPLVSTGYIWTCLLSVKYLKERMNTLKWAGIGCIILGVSLIGLGS